MKLMKKSAFYLLSMLLIGLGSCKKDNVDPKIGDGTIEFGLNIISDENIKKELSDFTNISAALVTIENESGDIIYELKKIKFYKFDQTFITEPLSLLTGNYKLTAFFLIDDTGTILYASPIEGSPKAYLVDTPLPIEFNIEKDKVTKLVPEVLTTEDCVPEDFGYSSFSFDNVGIFDFLITIFRYDETIQNFVLTTAEFLVISGTDTLYNGSLSAITNKITLNDSYSEYEVIVKKVGYHVYRETYTNAILRGHLVNPLTIVLEKNNLEKGLVAHYPFELNANDWSGMEYHGIEFGETHYTTGIKNYAREFVDNSSQEVYEYVEFPNSLNGEEYTVSFWMNTNNDYAVNQSILMLNNTNEWIYSLFWISISNMRLTAMHDGQDLRTKDYGITFDYSDEYWNSEMLEINKEYFVTYTYLNQTLTIYLNGEIYSQFENVKGVPGSNEKIRLGVAPNPNTSVGLAYQFSGYIDELFIYNRALSVEEILMLYQASL